MCTAECTQGGDQCPQGQVCDSNGTCVPDGSGMPDAACPAVHFSPTQVTPSVELLIDGSGSMNMSDISPTRYGAVANALTGPGGVVNSLQSKVYFGAAIFSSADPCPTLTAVPRALNNATAVDNLVNNFTPGGNTPTAPSISAVVADFQANPPPAGSPPIIVLATDGEPNSCTDNTLNPGPSIAAAQAAFAAGYRLYILGLANLNTQFLQDMANAGVGQAPPNNAPYYTADNPTQLQDAFNQIIGGVLSCDLTISGGTIDTSQAMSGTVILNGQALQYGTDWVLVNGNTIELIGGACDTLKNSANPTVDASFPCGAVIGFTAP